MTKRILLSLLTIGSVTVMTFSATTAYYSDTESTNNNTFTTGTLDLDIDGNNGSNTVKFTVNNMSPGNQPKGTYTLNNIGTINGYLDLENISVVSYENVCLDPEINAGDITCDDPGQGKGELQDVVNLRLFMDYGCDGWISTGDNVFYDGLVKDLAGSYELDEPLNAGAGICMVALFDWWPTTSDDLAQSDSMALDITFELAQTTGQ